MVPSWGTARAAELLEIPLEFQRFCLVNNPVQLDAPQSVRVVRRRHAKHSDVLHRSGVAGFSMRAAVVVVIEFVGIPKEFQQICLIRNAAT